MSDPSSNHTILGVLHQLVGISVEIAIQGAKMFEIFIST
jgi:hypothetical protein